MKQGLVLEEVSIPLAANGQEVYIVSDVSDFVGCALHGTARGGGSPEWPRRSILATCSLPRYGGVGGERSGFSGIDKGCYPVVQGS